MSFLFDPGKAEFFFFFFFFSVEKMAIILTVRNIVIIFRIKIDIDEIYPMCLPNAILQKKKKKVGRAFLHLLSNANIICFDQSSCWRNLVLKVLGHPRRP